MKIGQWNMTKHPVCFITGNSGDGKTWLCTRMAEEAMQAGATVILADPVKGWDIDVARLRQLEQAGATIIGMDEYDRLIETLDDVQEEMTRRLKLLCDCGATSVDALPEPVPPIVLMMDDFTDLLWLGQRFETPNDQHVRIERLVARFGIIMPKARLLNIRLAFIGKRIEKDMLPNAWRFVPRENSLHLLSTRINGSYEVFTGRLNNSGTVSYPELERKLSEQANRPDAATLRMVTAHIREELEAQRTMLADRQRMGIGDNAMQVGAITALERLNAWCAQQYDTTNPYMDSPATRKETTRP